MSNYGRSSKDGARLAAGEADSRRAAPRKRVLFVAEALTLAQVVRLLTLARGLDPERYEVHFACGPFDAVAFEGSGIEPLPLFTVDRAAALKKVDRGDRLYESDVLSRYVEDELALFDQVKPDLVVGDFRLSLAVSATRAGIPHATLINAYFGPYAEREGFPVPDHPLVSLLGAKRAAEYFPRALPLVFAHFVAPLDAVRKRYGLSPSGGLLQALTAGDFTLYPDVPELCPTRNAPSSHRYLGHVPWSPALPLPDFFQELDPRIPLVYVTLGSSGRYSALKAVLRVIGEFRVQAVVSTAGRFVLPDVPSNVRVAPYVPGALVARASHFVITNGGASTSYQALAEGRPVLGVPSNLDQYLAMTAIERASAGRLVRSGEATPATVRAAFTELLTSSELQRGAGRVARAFAAVDCHERFDAFLSDVFDTKTKERSA
jgi:UDP:flavonoid glycosyltransferase YjiC (YdhE family)